MLTDAQREVVEHYKALNTTNRWFTGEVQADGSVEVLALGPAGDWLWSFVIQPDGTYSSEEANVSDWPTGIEV